jgi:hypothetical protein
MKQSSTAQTCTLAPKHESNSPHFFLDGVGQDKAEFFGPEQMLEFRALMAGSVPAHQRH